MGFSSTIYAEAVPKRSRKNGKMNEKSHRPLLIVPIVLVPIVFGTVCFFNAMAASDAGQGIGLFLNNTGAVARKFDTEIQPAGWAFSIWGPIYVWQALWICYSVSTIFRQGIDGYLYYSPPALPPLFSLCFILNNLLNIGWLLTWDRQLLVVALIFLALMTFAIYLCLISSFRALGMYQASLMEHGLCREVWAIRVLVQNGVAMYATWITIATLLNLSSTLVYSANMANDVACTICLSVLSVEILLWVGLDTFLLDAYTRYLITPHCVIIFALSAIVAKNYVAGSRNSIFCVVLLALGIAALASKITLMVVRHIRSPNMKLQITPEIQMAYVDHKKYNQDQAKY